MAQFNYVTGKTYWTKVLGSPGPNYNRDGNEWTFDFAPDADGLKKIKELGIEHKLKNKDDERGTFIQFKQREIQANGKPNFPITVVDARDRRWDPDIKIGNGSTVEVKFRVVDYGKDKAKIARYGVYPAAIRVLELQPYERQEFAPLPEDSKYLDNFAEPVEDFEEGAVEGDPLDG